MRVDKEMGDKLYPEIKQNYNHVDVCTRWFVKQPEYYDVIVTENLFGDIITDLAAIMASASPPAATSTQRAPARSGTWADRAARARLQVGHGVAVEAPDGCNRPN